MVCVGSILCFLFLCIIVLVRCCFDRGERGQNYFQDPSLTWLATLPFWMKICTADSFSIGGQTHSYFVLVHTRCHILPPFCYPIYIGLSSTALLVVATSNAKNTRDAHHDSRACRCDVSVQVCTRNIISATTTCLLWWNPSLCWQQLICYCITSEQQYKEVYHFNCLLSPATSS